MSSGSREPEDPLRWREGARTLALERRLVESLLSRGPPPARRPILDAGTGTGQLLPLLTDRGAPVLALDRELRFLRGMDPGELARSSIHRLRGGIEAIPLRDASVPTVICIRVFHRLRDPRRALLELRRVIPLNGILLLSFQPRGSWKPWLHRWWRSFGGRRSRAPWEAVDPAALAGEAGFALEASIGSGVEELPVLGALPLESLVRLGELFANSPLFPTRFGLFRAV